MMIMIRARPSIVLFGDSITQYGFSAGGGEGWAGLLADAYVRRADVLNRGFSGYNTRHALDILPSVFGSYEEGGIGSTNFGRPLFISVFFGANDASLPNDDEFCQHVPIDEYESNLRKIVHAIGRKLQGDTKPPIILMTPPPVDQPRWDKWCMDDHDALSPRSNEVSKLYGDRVKIVAKELGCSVVDSFCLLCGDDSKEIYGKNLVDGLHLNGSGNKLLFKGFMNVIRCDFPELAPMKDGEGKGDRGIPVEGKLWKDMF